MSSNSHLHGLIPKQPSRLVSYLVAGKLIHFAVVLFVFEAYIYGILLNLSIIGGSNFWIIFWAILFGFSFIHIFLVMADGWSRFQDYKRAKDQLFIYGFHLKIINQYSGSQCQRTAFSTAAKELGFGKETKEHYYNMGYRWYNFIPNFILKDPFFFYKKYFWKRTFLEKYYKPKFNFQQLYLELQY
jgi:hypothetical protein